jgi:uncharacterized protein YsxB (DUF464 family)
MPLGCIISKDNQDTGLTPPHACACTKPWPGFPTSYIVVLFGVQYVIACFINHKAHSIQNIYQQYTESISTVNRIYINSIQNLYQQYTESISTVYRIYINSIQNLFQQYTEYISTVYRIYINRIQNLIYILYTVDIYSVYCWYRFCILLI